MIGEAAAAIRVERCNYLGKVQRLVEGADDVGELGVAQDCPSTGHVSPHELKVTIIPSTLLCAVQERFEARNYRARSKQPYRLPSIELN